MEQDQIPDEEDDNVENREPNAPAREDTRSRKLPQYLAALSAAVGGFLLGTVLGWSAPAVPIIEREFDATSGQIGLIGSLATLGGAVIMLPMAFMLDKFGRKLVMLGLILPFIAGWFVLAFIYAIPGYYVGRFITGLCGAGYCVAVPIYTSEIAEKDIRGRLGVFFQLMVVLGILFAYVIGYSDDILVMSLVCGLLPIVFGVIFFFMPESPLFLLMKEYPEQAKLSLQWFRGKQYDISEEMTDMKNFIDESKKKDSSIKELWNAKAARKGLLISIGLMFCQQLSGINVIIFYSVSIFKLAGSKMSPLLAAIILALIQVVSTVVAAATVDRAGRKILLIVSHAVMGLCLIGLGVFFTFVGDNKKEEHESKSLGFLALVAVGIYICAFSLGSGPLPWAMLGELLAPEVKGIAGSVSACINWVLAFVVSFTFPLMADNLGVHITFWIYAVLCFLGTAFIVFFVIETKGKTLDEIQRELEG
uniref:Major facilitator superfamily (MFS) profile domain-containing protein n=1 Tax=Timema douglasi TaxID=61478 RepID=A0A7R8VZT0_TIMDO|nr:unnamed protein product [Timema douglasi]